MLINYDKDNISNKTLLQLEKYINDPLLSIEHVKKVSIVASTLSMFVQAIYQYGKMKQGLFEKSI
jgi:hypothetical protein